MPRPQFEVADIVRSLGASLREGLARDQHRVVSAITACRTAVLGGHTSRCEDCAHIDVAYNSCRNRHCPKCQAAAAHDWLEARKDDLLPVAYYHVVFTLPAPIADMALRQQGRGLRRAVQGDCRDADDHRRGPEGNRHPKPAWRTAVVA